MNRSEKNKDLYVLLPRFVKETTKKRTEKDGFLPTLTRSFERNGIRFDFIITPASIYFENDENGGNYNFYAGPTEELVEAALRQLTIKENPNFTPSEDLLRCSLGQLMNEIAEISNNESLGRDEIKLALKIMSNTSYELLNDNRHMCFHPINQLAQTEKDGETYYLIVFSSMFFNSNELFDFCFGFENPNKTKSGGI